MCVPSVLGLRSEFQHSPCSEDLFAPLALAVASYSPHESHKSYKFIALLFCFKVSLEFVNLVRREIEKSALNMLCDGIFV